MDIPRIPSLNWLRVFEAAARTGSFARAAETLNMSPPAVSQQIRALEGHLGRDLFERGPRSVTLNEAGLAFLPVVAEALHSIEMASANLFGDRRTLQLTVQSSLLLAAGWLSPRLPVFQQRHSGIRLTLLNVVHEHQPARADLTITFGRPPSTTENSDPLFGETIYPVAPPDIAAEIATPGDLADWPLIEIATHRANWSAILPSGGPPPRIIYTDNTLSALSLAAAGAIALARAPACGELPARFGLEPCLPGYSIAGVQRYSLVYGTLGRAGRRFRDWLLANAAEAHQSIRL